jgi:glyoxylase-like metal-dependent hydrolase (beta-lactamase superfamily II)
VTHIVNTHGHGDHIGANAALKEAFPAARLCIHARDSHMLTDPRANFSLEFDFNVTSPPADVTLTGNTELNAGGLRFRVEHVPGHSPGSICLVGLFEPRIVVTGDTLFAGGVGRTDFPGGNMGLLLSGIKEKILSLPDETIVLPGHGIRTTVGMEKRSNPYVGDVRWPQEPDADDEAGVESE